MCVIFFGTGKSCIEECNPFIKGMQKAQLLCPISLILHMFRDITFHFFFVSSDCSADFILDLFKANDSLAISWVIAYI